MLQKKKKRKRSINRKVGPNGGGGFRQRFSSVLCSLSSLCDKKLLKKDLKKTDKKILAKSITFAPDFTFILQIRLPFFYFI